MAMADISTSRIIEILGNISNNSGQIFIGQQKFDANNISFASKRKRSDDDFKSFNTHYEVPNNVSTHFTGRVDILEELKQKILPFSGDEPSRQSQRRYVLFGLGGSGKTQIAMKFAEDNREKFWGIFWIDASSDSTADRALIEIAKLGRLDDQSPKSGKRWLTNLTRPWLLILDNADDSSMRLSNYIPASSRGTVLITTRNPETRSLATAGWREISIMPEKEALDLLIKGISNVLPTSALDAETLCAAKQVIETLGYIPLAIAQAAGAIRQNICGLQDYCKIFSKRRKYLMERAGGDESSNYEYTAYAAWEISLNAVESKKNDVGGYALKILNLLSCVHFTGLSEKLFYLVWTTMTLIEKSDPARLYITYEAELFDLLQGWDEDSTTSLLFREAVSLLSSFSLVQVSISDNYCVVSMHPLVHLWARDRIPPAQRSWWYRITTQFLNAVTPNLAPPESSTISNLTFLNGEIHRVRRMLLPHIEALISQVGIPTMCTWGLRCHPVHDFANIYREHGELEKCLSILKPAIDIYEKGIGKSHPHTLNLLRTRAIAQLQRGDGTAAILKQLKSWVGLSVATNGGLRLISQSLFMIYTRERIYEENPAADKPLSSVVCTILERVQAIISTFKDQEKPTLLSQSWKVHLAELYILSRRFEQAKFRLEIAMAFTLQEWIDWGDKHPPWRKDLDIFRIYQAFCIIYWYTGEKQRASEIMEGIVKHGMKLNGSDHVLTLQSVKILEAMKEGGDIPREWWIQRFG